MINKAIINQKGIALMVLVFFVAIIATAYLIHLFEATDIKVLQQNTTNIALSEAKSAIIGDAIKNSDVSIPPYLSNPDLKLTSAIPEGSESGLSGGIDISLIGKIPWRTLDLSNFKDGNGECLWYVLSGRFKYSPNTAVLNWDTLGQINVIDGSGTLIAQNLAALIISPGSTITGQDRSLAFADTPQCGGNYNVSNYLDTPNIANAIAGEMNYFNGSVNNRTAPNVNNKSFVLVKNDFYNDQMIFITTDDIFTKYTNRADFSIRVSGLLDDADLRKQVESTSPEKVVISGNKGTDNIDCSKIVNTQNKTFCVNWREMLFLTDLPTASNIVIDGTFVGPCSRVLIFGGRKTGSQLRFSVADRSNKTNYLEGVNLTSFNTPIANAPAFTGISTFQSNNSSGDILRCL